MSSSTGSQPWRVQPPVQSGRNAGSRAAGRTLHLVPAVPGPVRDVVLDESQRRAITEAMNHPVAAVAGAPGTGKTTTALSLAAQLLRRQDDDAHRVLVLAATRRGAGQMRQDLAALAGRTVSAPLVRTAASVAFAVLERFTSALDLPAPTLISGPEQDLLLAELLAGHVEDFANGRPRLELPLGIPLETLGTRGFRDELRDVMMRASERGLDPVALDALGKLHNRPQWRLSAVLFQEYRDVTVLQQVTPDAGPRYDPAVVVDAALDALVTWEVELPGVPRPAWRHVIVDDHQESTAAVARFLQFIVADGSALTLFGDPDAAAQSFRGAVPRLMAAAGTPRSAGRAEHDPGAFGAHEITLEHVWRHGAPMRAVTQRVSHAVASVGTVRHRFAEAATSETSPEPEQAPPTDAEPDGAPGRVNVQDSVEPQESVGVALLGSPAQEHAFIAHELRSQHLFHQVPWSQMAVIARSGGQITALQRALASASVPVSVLSSAGAMRDEPAVRPLLTALDCVVHGQVEAEDAVQLLLSALGGLDAVSLRRLRRVLRSEELAGGGGRSSDALLVDVLSSPAHAATLPSSVRQGAHRVAQVLEQGQAALAQSSANAQTVLWAVWNATGLAERWRHTALQGGSTGARADHDLDAVLALFKAAERFVERTHGATPGQFVEYVRSQELPADSLAAHGGTQEAVSVLTPASAAGRQWDVVVVAGVQEGVWPDLRLRDSLLGAQVLIEVEAARDTAAESDEARRLVLADEVRAFLVAISRARRTLLVTAVADTENTPSILVDLVEPPQPTPPSEKVDSGAGGDTAVEDATDESAADDDGVDVVDDDETVDPRMRQVPPALNLRGLIGATRHQLRAELTQHNEPDAPASPRAVELAALLARLVRAGLTAADPQSWYHVNPVSTSTPVLAEDRQVRVSPSKVESVTTCALRWALETAGGRASEALSQSLGNLIHAIAEELPTGTASQLAARLDARWPELGLPDGWPSLVTRRRADRMVTNLAGHLKDSDVVAVEAAFTLELGRAVLSGKVDRVVRDAAGRIHLEDLKTGATAPSVKTTETNAQLGAYQLALDAGAFAQLPPGSESGGAELIFVATGKSAAVREQPPLATSADPNWASELVTAAAHTMTQPEFVAQINDTCTNCPVRRSCPLQPEGRHVGIEPHHTPAEEQ